MASAVNCCAPPFSLTSLHELIYCDYGDNPMEARPSFSSPSGNINPVHESSGIQNTSLTFDHQIAFTNLTARQHGDRRQKGPTIFDKEANSGRRIRRRAQNRASQRAFRERKEKYVLQLEQRLARLDSKYQTLDQSYSDLVVSHRKLEEEVAQLRCELEGLDLLEEQSPLKSITSSLFDPCALEKRLLEN